MKSKEGFQTYVRRLEDYIDREQPDRVTVEQASVILGISPNYARMVLKAVAEKRGYYYHWGVLYVGSGTDEH